MPTVDNAFYSALQKGSKFEPSDFFSFRLMLPQDYQSKLHATVIVSVNLVKVLPLLRMIPTEMSAGVVVVPIGKAALHAGGLH